MNRNLSSLGQRIVTALLFGLVLLVPIFLGPVPGAMAIGVLCLLTVLEFLQLQGYKGAGLWIKAVLAMLMYLALCLMVFKEGIVLPVKYAIYLSMAFGALLLIRLYKKADPFAFNFQVVPATLYIAIPLALLYAISHWNDEYSAKWVLGVLLFVWINDILAYLIGKKFGKHPFSRFISPNKTWEGTIAGWVGCLIMAVILWKILGEMGLGTWIILGLITGVSSSVGDLIESLFKRKKGIKDSGTFLPGHGGFLDRVDSLLFALPFVAFYLFILL